MFTFNSPEGIRLIDTGHAPGRWRAAGFPLSTPLRELDSLIQLTTAAGASGSISFNSPEGIRLIDTRKTLKGL